MSSCFAADTMAVFAIGRETRRFLPSGAQFAIDTEGTLLAT
jgi:hypothetical protein